MVRRGLLIVLEGAEGVGKSTQVGLLTGYLAGRGVPHLAVREPGGTALGDVLRELVLGPGHDMTAAAEALLFMASRAELVARVVSPALAESRVVVADRFFLSTYAYQIAGRGLAEADVRAANRLATGGLVPDLTILLDLHVADGLARADRRSAGGRDRMEASPDAFHQRVDEAFRRFAEPRWQAGHPECGPITSVDARGTEDEVHRRLLGVLGARFAETFPESGESHRGMRTQDLSRT